MWRSVSWWAPCWPAAVPTLRPMSRLKDICIDCADPWTLAHWWADVLGYEVRPWSEDDLAQLRAQGIERPEDDDSVALDDPDGGPSVWFVRVPEPKTVKNRLHLDVYGDVDDLMERGATVVARLEHWTVLTDPAGNELCVFPLSDQRTPTT
jgi:hypothetical protein